MPHTPHSLFHILVLFLLSKTIAQNPSQQNPSSTSCCVITEPRLNLIAAENPDCSSSHSHILNEKCQSCPTPGTCRLDNRCICAEFFLSSRHSQCSNAFGTSWPSSISKEDRDWRSCHPNHTPPPANATSCCAMSEHHLQALRGFSPECPSSSYRFQLTEKCDTCPPGLCRQADECICPDRFLDRTTLHPRCADSFTVSWPQSVGKEDRATRSCRGVPAPNTPKLSCCSLTDKQLNQMIGTSHRCPDSSVVLISDACGTCPKGMCRFGRSCYCPTRFLTSSVKDTCERTFGVAWPESIGKPDPDIAGCANETKASPTTTEQSNDSSPVPEDGSATESKIPHTPGPSDPSASKDPNTENSLPDSSGTSDSSAGKDTPTVVNSNDRLTTLEIVGIVAGVVSAVVAVFVAVVGLTRYRKNRHPGEPSFDDLLS